MKIQFALAILFVVSNVSGQRQLQLRRGEATDVDQHHITFLERGLQLITRRYSDESMDDHGAAWSGDMGSGSKGALISSIIMSRIVHGFADKINGTQLL